MSELADWLQLDPAASAPLFDQLRTQIIEGIRRRRLPAGTRMPTVRALAAQLGLAVNTVAKAYRELEVAGMVETRGRKGTFVCGVDPAAAAMGAAARAYVDTAQSLGVGSAEAVRYVKAAFGNG